MQLRRIGRRNFFRTAHGESDFIGKPVAAQVHDDREKQADHQAVAPKHGAKTQKNRRHRGQEGEGLEIVEGAEALGGGKSSRRGGTRAGVKAGVGAAADVLLRIKIVFCIHSLI